jgi:hypothetical protein
MSRLPALRQILREFAVKPQWVTLWGRAYAVRWHENTGLQLDFATAINEGTRCEYLQRSLSVTSS